MATIRGTDAWVPIPAARFLRRSNLIVLDPAQRERRWILAKGRLRANRSVADAVADVTRIGGELDAQYPLPAADGPASRRNWYTVPASTIHVHESVSDQMVPIAWLAMAILVSAWLGACTNVANLAFAAGGARQAEYALRNDVALNLLSATEDRLRP